MSQLDIGLFDNNLPDDYIDLEEASLILGVSPATLRNWVKIGHIRRITGQKKPVFRKSDIELLHAKLKDGSIDKLKTRANKKHSTTTFIPKEYLLNRNDYQRILSVISYIHTKKIPTSTALFLLSLNRLYQARLVSSDVTNVHSIKNIAYKHSSIQKVMTEWRKDLPEFDLNAYKELLIADLPKNGDVLGGIYQSLLLEGDKAQGGSYYTPDFLVNAITQQLKKDVTSTTEILDPCCGTGQFLLSFSTYVKDPRHLWGYDIDTIAVHIARVNVILTYKDSDFFPNIFVANALEIKTEKKFDVIATNPPWGSHFTKSQLARLHFLYPTITSKEAFSYFILMGYYLLKDNGKLTYVLPESILKVKQHSDIRKYLVEKTTITEITHVGKVFANVLSPVILLSFQKAITRKNQVTITQNNSLTYQIEQSRFKTTTAFTFATGIANEDEALLRKIYTRDHITLKDNADWALGIVTGNNKSLVKKKREKNTEGVLKGSDIKRFFYHEPSSYIQFTPALFQQTAPESKYRAPEKLIYKFISSSLCFAYDTKRTLTLNSANILIPKIKNYPVKAVLAVLNSSLIQYVYKKKFNSIKILRGDLETLPLPTLDKSQTSQILSLTDKMTSPTLSKEEREDISSQLDAIMYSLFNLSESEIQHIKKSLPYYETT